MYYGAFHYCVKMLDLRHNSQWADKEIVWNYVEEKVIKQYTKGYPNDTSLNINDYLSISKTPK